MKIKGLPAFTLAEVLIAISVAGVIASIVMPTVIANYQKHAQVAMLKKTYVNLQRALETVKSDSPRGLYKSVLSKKTKNVEGTVTSRSVADTAGKFLDISNSDFAISKSCGTTAQPCFASKYKSLSGTTSNFSCEDGWSVLLKDGAAMCIIPADNSYTNTEGENLNAHPVVIYIDTNGSDSPNTGGRDMFTLNVYNDFSIDVIEPATARTQNGASSRETLFNSTCKSNAFGAGCFGKILNDNWKMNY